MCHFSYDGFIISINVRIKTPAKLGWWAKADLGLNGLYVLTHILSRDLCVSHLFKYAKCQEHIALKWKMEAACKLWHSTLQADMHVKTHTHTHCLICGLQSDKLLNRKDTNKNELLFSHWVLIWSPCLLLYLICFPSVPQTHLLSTSQGQFSPDCQCLFFQGLGSVGQVRFWTACAIHLQSTLHSL